MKTNIRIKLVLILSITSFSCKPQKAVSLDKIELNLLRQISSIANVISLSPQIIDPKNKKHLFTFPSQLSEQTFSAALEQSQTFITSLAQLILAIRKATLSLQIQNPSDTKKLVTYFTITTSKAAEIASKILINRFLMEKYKGKEQILKRRMIRTISSCLITNIFYLIPEFVKYKLCKERDYKNTFYHLTKGLFKNSPYFVVIPILSEIIGEWIGNNESLL